MIDEILISGLGVIDAAQFTPGPGFTALTGETGAGKTIVLTALDLLLGGKATGTPVRGDRAVVEGRWRVEQDSPAVAAVIAAGGDLDEGDILISRSVPAEGRSRASLGGLGVPAGTLARLAETLVVVHGQTDQHRLRKPSEQRGHLDAFAGESLAVQLAQYRSRYRELREVEAELSEREGEARARAAEADFLRFGLAEIERIAPVTGEDVELSAEDERLGNFESLVEACARAQSAISDADDEGADALTRLGEAGKALAQAGIHDSALADLAERVREASNLVADVSADISAYSASLEAEPGRLEWVQQRRATLARLTRKYGETIDEVLVWSATSAVRLADLEDDGTRVSQLRQEMARLRDELGVIAGHVSALRSQAATELATRVTTELAALAMPQANFHVEVVSIEDPGGLEVAGRYLAFGPDGVDNVAFLLAPHPGASPAPLGHGASGGELSRVMLAVEVACAGTAPVATMVFDEVDAGVGGKAAVEVGRRLARLAQEVQVIVVTHLPQVAAFADVQIVVTKDSDGMVTASSVAAVEGEARRREIARMLAGHEDSTHALAHADELLALGAEELASGSRRTIVRR